jgi:DNA-binding NarL/FixJ family response regulator
MRPLTVLVVDDHPLMVEAIDIALSRDEEFEIVGVAVSGPQVLRLAQRLKPDLVLLDLRLPGIDGFQVIHLLRREGVEAKIVVLSACEGSEIVASALRAGASAFITKRIDPDDLPAALRQALDQTLFQQPLRVNPLIENGRRAGAPLTERELAVLTAVAQGLSNKQIAQRLSYAEQTVKLDLTHVYRKLGVSSRTEAISVAYREGMIENDMIDLAPA